MGAGTLIGFATAAAASGIQAMFGAIGTVLVLLVFIGFGAPASGGPLSYHLLPGFYSAIGPYLPTGAGVDLTRNLLYFDGAAIARPLGVLAAWAVASVLIMLAVGRRSQRISAQTQAEVGGAGTASL